jgi:dihydroorotate dehydrogenase electron transfer subunit
MGAVGAAALTLDCPRKAEFHLGVPNVSWKPFAEMLSRRLEACEQSLRVFSEDGAIGEKGNALDGLPEDLSPSDRIWGCGTNGMMKALALKYKNRLSQIFMSLDAKMACGYGGCLGCVIDTVHGKKRACADGPVFRGDEVVWDAV